MVIGTLAVAGYVSAGKQIVREAAEQPGYARSVLDEANFTAADGPVIYRWAYIGFATHFALVGLTFAAVWGPRPAHRFSRPPTPPHSSGPTMRILPRPTLPATLRRPRTPPTLWSDRHAR